MRATRLNALLLLCLGLGLGGCLAPQEIEEVDPPDTGNAAPAILSRSPISTTVVSQKTCALSFQLHGVRDRDRSDTLEVRWFINYSPSSPDSLRQRETIPPPPDGADDIRLPEKFDIETSDFTGQQIVVEAVVSDGFDPDPNAEPKDRAILPNKGHDETSWIVRITNEECLTR